VIEPVGGVADNAGHGRGHPSPYRYYGPV
jgi:hypothetical protein